MTNETRHKLHGEYGLERGDLRCACITITAILR